MNELNILEVFNSSSDFTLIKSFRQHWSCPKFSYLENPRPDFGILFLINGRMDFVTNNETLSAKAGDMIFLPKNCYYEAIFRHEYGETDNYLINFEIKTTSPIYTKPTKIAEDAPLKCIDFFEAIVKEQLLLTNTDFYSKGLFYLLLDAIVKNAGSMSTAHKAVLDNACKLLNKNVNIPIREVARQCCVSESGLRKLFNDNFHISPAKYRMNIKLNKAKYLLESTNMSVNEVADELNFYDVAYFCKIFRDTVGMTPVQYARSKKL